MLKSTLAVLKCAAHKKCKGELSLLKDEGLDEIEYGTLVCKICRSEYPVLAGVAIIVEDVPAYLYYHVKGISKFVPYAKIPKAYRKDFLEAKEAMEEELTEEDLESDRVNALYLMNHYLSVKQARERFWQPKSGDGSAPIEQLIENYWDKGPLMRVSSWFKIKGVNTIELGCGVGGLFSKITIPLENYLGVDASFQSILLARHFNLGTPYSGDLSIPGDLLHGAASRKINFTYPQKNPAAKVDFVVGEMDRIPAKNNFWDVTVAMNVIDMLEDPRQLPEVQSQLLKPGGQAIQSDPYIWHEKISKRLRGHLPKAISNSARAVEHLYEKAGFKIEESEEHVPWIFFKHLRQVELYSVHAFIAKKHP